jgi:GTPase SAR1 family protein
MSLRTEMIPCESRPADKRLLKLKDHELLPSPVNGTMFIVGAAGSGKSSFIYSLFSNWMPNYFDELVIFCATKDSAETWNNST